MSNSNTSFKPSNEIQKEVENIFRKNKTKNKFQLMEELRAKHSDENIVTSIMKEFEKEMKKVLSVSNRIRERLLNKYPNESQKFYMEKIQSYQKKYKFSDAQLTAIINLVLLRKDGLIGPENLEPAVTDMGRALGFTPISYNSATRLRVDKSEQEQLEAIKNNFQLTRELHNQVTIQSLIYTDCDQSAIQFEFDKLKINIFNFVHPVVAALFFPKFKLLDHHMLLASIAGIITKKIEGIELNTLPEFELYWDIATDPADIACVNKVKPFTDLLNRVNIQTKLWESVLQLRQGKYYVNDITSFLMAVDACRASVFDAADLAYVKDEGTILRKLFSAFSLRPTIVITMPSLSINTNPNISNLASTHITTLSMITLRIPLDYSNSVMQDINLEEALTQDQIYIHHRQLTIKKQSILYSREILVFYIHRRYQNINIKKLTTPYALSALPITMSQFERLQSSGVICPDTITLPGYGQQFNLKSAVTVEIKLMDGDASKPIIVSCSTLVKCNNIQTGEDGSPIAGYCYNPLNLQNTATTVETIELVNTVDIEARITERGTLFIYQMASEGRDEPDL